MARVRDTFVERLDRGGTKEFDCGVFKTKIQILDAIERGYLADVQLRFPRWIYLSSIQVLSRRWAKLAGAQ